MMLSRNPPGEGRAPSTSLERAFLLLEMIERTPGGLRHAEISRRLQIPKSTCTYILKRLERDGYVTQRDESGRFTLGLTPLVLAHGALRQLGFRSIAEPSLYLLVNETGLSAGIGVLERGRVLLVDRVEGGEFVDEVIELAREPRAFSKMGNAIKEKFQPRELRDIGRELPLHATALGKVLLTSFQGQALARRIPRGKLERWTQRTIVSRAKLMTEIAAARLQGYATSDEELYRGTRSVAAPITDSSGVIRAAVSVNGGPHAPAWRDLDRVIRLVKSAAQEISLRGRFS